jgi:hypothetical protein
MLTVRRVLAVAVLLLAVGTGGARALAPTANGIVHGECTFSSLAVHAGAGTFQANGTGTCVVNGVSTVGTLGIAGPLDLDACPVKLGGGAASLALGGSFPQLNGSARAVVHGTASTIVFVGGLAGTGSFVELLRGTCLPDTVWTGTVAF